MMMGSALLAAMLAQAQPSADCFSDDAGGISIQKPPGNDEWEFQSESGRVAVLHRVRDIAVAVEILVVVNANNYSTKNAAEDTWKQIRDGNKFKEIRRTGLKQTKLPGKSAEGVFAHRLDMTFKGDGDKPMEWQMYLFNSRATSNFYQRSEMELKVVSPIDSENLESARFHGIQWWVRHFGVDAGAV